MESVPKRPPKRRKFSEDYIKFGFTYILRDDIQCPQCVICLKILTNDSLRPSRLQRHMSRKHSELMTMPKEFFIEKLKEKFPATDAINEVNDINGTQDEEKIEERVDKATILPYLKASFEIAYLIAKNKKPYGIGEDLIKPCILKSTQIVLGDECEQRMREISLSNTTIRRRIQDLAADIKAKIREKVISSPYFAISCDESTDISDFAQLIVYVRYVGAESIEEDILYAQSLESGTTSDDIFNSISAFIEKNGLYWSKLVGIHTDGALSIIGAKSDLNQKLKEMSPLLISTHYSNHRYALGVKTLPHHLCQTLDLSKEIINHVKSNGSASKLFTLLHEDLDINQRLLLLHTDVSWLSKGNLLAKLYDLKEEVILYLEYKRKSHLLQSFNTRNNQLRMAYLADILQALDQLNNKLQSKNTTMISSYNHIAAFILKLDLWTQKVSAGDLISFPRLYEAASVLKFEQNLAVEIVDHLQALKVEFEYYTQDINTESPIWHMTRNPFTIDVMQLPEEYQEEYLEMMGDATAKDDFHLFTLEKFWVKRYSINSNLASLALQILTPFSSTSLTEAGIEALISVKTKQRNRIDVDSNLTVALAKTTPSIDDLVQNRQGQVSH